MITYTYTCMLKELLLHFEHDTLKFLRVGKTSKYSRKKIQKSDTNLINAKECFGFTNLSLKSRPLNKIMTKQ